MKTFVIGVVVGLTLFAGLATALDEQHYVLRPIVNWETDPAICAADKGRGSNVYVLDADGSSSEAPQSYCILEAKH